MTDSKLDLKTAFSQENLSREDILELRKNVYSSEDELENLNKNIQKLKKTKLNHNIKFIIREKHHTIIKNRENTNT